MHGEYWKLQYKELHDVSFICGSYGHRDMGCPTKSSSLGNEGTEAGRLL